MIYIGSPYTSPLQGELKLAAERQRYSKVLEFVTFIVQTGGPAAFSPIAYYHPIAIAKKLPTDANFWMKINLDYLRRSEAMFVLRIGGWETSKGLAVEMNVAEMLGIPVIHYNDKFEEVRIN